MNTRLEYH